MLLSGGFTIWDAETFQEADMERSMSWDLGRH